MKEPSDIDFKALNESLMNPLALGPPKDQISFSLFVFEKEGDALVVLIPKQGNCY